MPEPSRRTTVSVLTPNCFSLSFITDSPASQLPSPLWTLPISFTNVSACPLLLNFMNGMKSSFSGIDFFDARTVALLGVMPVFVPPLPTNWMPCSASDFLKTSSVNSVGSQTADHDWDLVPSTGIFPSIMILFVPCSRAMEMLFASPFATVVARLTICTKIRLRS